MIDPVRFSIEEEARNLAALNAEADADIQEIWWFPDPDKDEIRLMEIDPTLPGSEGIAAFSFRSSPIDGIHFPLAIALIRPDERELPLPEGWVGWNDAVLLYQRKGDSGGR